MGQSTAARDGSTPMKQKIPSNPCGVGVPGWPRLMSIPCAAAYLSRTTGFVEARLRAGEIPFHKKDAEERVIDRLELDAWIAKQPKMTGKLRHPKAATEARKLAA
jgi:hypothetical protein